MKTISNDFKKLLEKETTNIVKCWKIIKKDNTSIGFTTNTDNFVYENILYHSFFAKDFSNILSNLEKDEFEITNIISSDLLKNEDILNGKYDSAKIEIFLIDNNNLNCGKIILLSGIITNIEIKENVFIAKVKGIKEEINKTIGERYSPLCRCSFCDKKCGLDKNNFSFTGKISNIVDKTTFKTKDEIILSKPTYYFDYGIVEFLSGKNKGEKMEIKQYSNGTFILSLNLPYELNINDEFKVLAGCNKNFSTCCEKFYNAKNFRGEPHLPGINILLKIK